MKIFGITIGRKKAAQPLRAVDGNRGWFNLGWLGGPSSWLPETWFQRDIEVPKEQAYANWCVFACMTLIAGDGGKVCLKLVESIDGIWSEAESSSFSPVIRKPNRYQTRQMFIEQWILSKLSTGNTYVLKERDARDVVVRLYVLDPRRVQPLVAPDGSVYYQLYDDDLAGIPTGMPAIPASEIIHDRFNCLFHPLVGLSPLYASALAAGQGLRIQQQSATFFANGARPSGIITAPAQIAEPVAERIKKHWESGYSGENRGKVAVLGDGLTFAPMTQNAVDSEVVEQLKLTAVMVCATFHVPPHAVGAAPVPPNNNVEALELQYYSKALQPHFESIEALLDEGLGLTEKKEGRQYGTYFELDDLLKMDQASLMAALKIGVDGSILSPNDARRRLNYKPAPGGASPMAQQQQYSLAALAERDQDKPFAKPAPGTPATPAAPANTEPPAVEEAVKSAIDPFIRQAAAAEVARVAREDAAEVERRELAEAAEAERDRKTQAAADAWAARMQECEAQAAERAEAERVRREAREAAAAEEARILKAAVDELRAQREEDVRQRQERAADVEAKAEREANADDAAEALATALIARMSALDLLDA